MRNWVSVLCLVWLLAGCSGKTSTGMDETGTIEGSLSYPSEGIPPMKICAEDINTKEQYCTTEHLKNSKYLYGEGYKISAPVGQYYVFATVSKLGDYRAYYSKFECGNGEGTTHDPILVSVKSGETISGVDVCDWYKPLEESDTTVWKTYTDDDIYGFTLKYPESWEVSIGYKANILNFMPVGGQDVNMSMFVFYDSLEESEKFMPVFDVAGRKIDSRTNVTINGINWVKLVVDGNQIVQLTYHDKKTYAFQYSIFEDISPQILSTFKLTE